MPSSDFLSYFQHYYALSGGVQSLWQGSRLCHIHTHSRKMVPVLEDLKSKYLTRHNRCIQQTLGKHEVIRRRWLVWEAAATAHQMPGRCQCISKFHCCGELSGGIWGKVRFCEFSWGDSFATESTASWERFGGTEVGSVWKWCTLSPKCCVAQGTEEFCCVEMQLM